MKTQANPGQWHNQQEQEQIFSLIENTLSFEVCLYHQILPFKLEDNKLLLGMVNPQDKAALDYTNRIFSGMNCVITVQSITADAHRQILSAYLNFKNTSQSTSKNTSSTKSPDTNTVTSESLAASQRLSKLKSENSQKKNFHTQSSQESTFLLEETQTPVNSASETEKTSSTKPKASANSPKVTSLGESDTQGGLLTAIVKGSLMVLQIPPMQKLSSFEELIALPPKKILEQLLSRVLAGGIGRLYLERQPYQGRILWSENGVLQSVLEKVPLSAFQGVLNELKRFASLPVITLAEPRQVERECLYQKDRLLLRLRVMPGMYGEEATLQVLRGAALKFYQQQQLTRISRDALGMSQQLNYKLRELRQRLVVNSDLDPNQSEAFFALNQMLENFDKQINKILSDSPEDSNK